MNKSNLKKEALAHYNRMIKWAKEQNKLDQPSSTLMLTMLEENWQGAFCKYCTTFREQNAAFIFNCCEHNEYGICPLNINTEKTSTYCCDGLWIKMAKSETWEEWIVNAKLVKNYIKENG